MISQPHEIKQFVGVDGIVVIRSEEVQRFGWPHAGRNAAGLQHHSDAGDKLAMVGDRVEAQHPNGTGRGTAIALEGFNR
jgi:hypothetical protein